MVAGQLTIEARNAIRQADIVLYLVACPMTGDYLKTLNPRCESLYPLYRDGQKRIHSYMGMVHRVLEEARKGEHVCFAMYGHPGVFSLPTHESMRQARAEGIPARMIPGISAEDCMFADLGVEPGIPGIQSFEATDFLIHRRKFDETSQLVLWQIGAIGDLTFRAVGDYSRGALKILADYLEKSYGGDHQVVVYEAPTLPINEPRVENIPLKDLAAVAVTAISTLYVPPCKSAHHARAPRDGQARR
jgi:uncharacterized protein YabN with tetrapyrrole methylase and pyrophosphatase domain